MNFKYRVKGKVSGAFILRGLHFAVGDDINFDVSDKELEFVKAHCNLETCVDLTKQTFPNPVLEEPKGEKENVELHKPNASRKTKVKVSG